MDTYYAAVGSGNSWTGATLHIERDCTDEHLTPLSADAIDVEACEFCPDCAGGGGEPTGTCDVVKGDGDVCGRDRPCPYHD